MKTKENLVDDLANKGPSYTLNYLKCYYKEVELFCKTNLLEPLLKQMSPEGQEKFKKTLDIIKNFNNNSGRNKDYEAWCEECKNKGFSNEDQSAAAAKPESPIYKSITAYNDFYENCKIEVRDRVALTKDYGCFPKGFVGTVIDYSIDETINKNHPFDVEFRLEDSETNKLYDIEEHSLRQDILEVVERWNPITEQYTTRFEKDALVFPDYEPIELTTIFNDNDKELYGYPYTENPLKKVTNFLRKKLKG